MHLARQGGKERSVQFTEKDVRGLFNSDYGVGILLVLLLPATGWLFLIGAVVVLVGLIWLSC